MWAKLKKKWKRKLLAKLLAGNNVECNVCNRKYAGFFPYLNRANAQCPNCGSLERTRLIYRFITELELLRPGSKMLHIAPEAALFQKFKTLLGDGYLPADKFEEGYTYPNGTLNMDITAIELPDNSMDMVMAIHVLEHVPDDAKALREVYRVLKPGGVAILQVPYEADRKTTYEDAAIVNPAARRQHFGQSDHVRIYGNDYIERFVQPGFIIEHADYAARIDKATRERYVFKDEEIFLLRKPLQ
jgi:SAM-dependent methyltransferase